MKKAVFILSVSALIFAFSSCTQPGDTNNFLSSVSSVSSVSQTVSEFNSSESNSILPESHNIENTAPSAHTATSAHNVSKSTGDSCVKPVENPVIPKSDKMSLSEYIDTQQPAIAAMQEPLKDVMTIALTAKGKSMIYTYTYVIDAGDIDLLKPALEAQEETLEATMKPILKATKLIVDDIESIIVEYFTKDNEKITSFEFK